MTDEEVAVKMATHEHEIDSLKRRMEDQEDRGKTIQDLVMSVQKLAINMEAMLKEQNAQGERLSALEQEPAQRWNNMTRTIFTTIVSTIAGALATGLIVLIAQNLH